MYNDVIRLKFKHKLYLCHKDEMSDKTICVQITK